MKKLRRKIFNIIQIGSKGNFISRFFDFFIVVMIIANIAVTVLDTFDEMEHLYGLFCIVELVTTIVFTIEYILRLWTADFLYPEKKRISAIVAFIFSFYGLIDLLSFLPYYLPIFFPAGIVAFRMLRVIRIFRLFKINARYDAINVITDVLKEKKNQLLSSVVLIFIMMLASSLVMYSLEHEAQPDQFRNAFSGIWWSASTLLTVGYGDIYPVTIGGRIMAIAITFLGVGMVAIPTGIISAGFVEQYTKLKRQQMYAEEKELRFITSTVSKNHQWNGKNIKDITLPPEFVLAVVVRNGEVIIPRGDTKLIKDDTLVFAAKHYEKQIRLELKEIIVKEENPWVGKAIKDLDFSRLEIIIMIERGKSTVIPNGSTIIHADDKIIMYSKQKRELIDEQ